MTPTVGKPDEAPEFDRDVLDALRQALESGKVVISRSGVTARVPAQFTLVLGAIRCRTSVSAQRAMTSKPVSEGLATVIWQPSRSPD